MKPIIIEIRRSYDENGLLLDGVTIIMNVENEIIERPFSSTNWSTCCADHNFDIFGVILTEDQIQKVNHLLNPNAE